MPELVLIAALGSLASLGLATGAIAGAGREAGRLDRRMLAAILAAWLITLPTAALLAAAVRWVLP